MIFLKKIVFTLIVSMFMFMGICHAEEKIYVTETLKEACDTEGLECTHTEKEYDESLPNVYIFRGNGCPYCNRLLTYVSSIIDKYQVNVIVYEVKDNKDNWALYKKVGAKFNFVPSGYPYMVIGEKTFDGYASDYDEDIASNLESFQNEEEPYDVVEDVLDDPEETNSRGIVLAFIFGVVIVIGLLLGYKVNSKKNE